MKHAVGILLLKYEVQCLNPLYRLHQCSGTSFELAQQMFLILSRKLFNTAVDFLEFFSFACDFIQRITEARSL